MFTTFIVQPIFNLLVCIYAILPGHNFGLALILFTIVIRLILWPLVRKQLHQTKAMRKLQPEINKIKKATKGNRQKESLMLMELYKERGINPFSTLPTLVVQFIVLIGLYSGLQKVIKDPHSLIDFAYGPLQNLSWLKELSQNIKLFDNTLFGIVDLSRPAINAAGGIYLGALLLVIGSAVAQYLQAKQLLPQVDQKRSLREIMRDAGAGKQADQAEVNAAVSQKTIYLLPAVVLLFTIKLPAALSLYWLSGGVVAYIQQSIVLNRDETEMEAMATPAAKPAKNLQAIPEAEVVTAPADTANNLTAARQKSKKTTKQKSGATKRRKR